MKEIHDLQNLRKLRPESFVVGRMQAVLINKIQACQLSSTVALKLLSTIQDSELPDEMKEALMDTVDQQASSNMAGPLRLTTTPQTLRTVYNYVSNNELKTLLQMSSNMDALPLISARLRMIGLKSLKECTKKNVTALLLHLALRRGEALPTVQELYKLSGFVASSFAACAVEPKVSGYAVYPPTPQELGEDFLSKAYPDGDVPDLSTRSNLATSANGLMKQFYVRNTGSQMKPSKAGSASVNTAAEQTMAASIAMEKCCSLLTGLVEKAKTLGVQSLSGSLPATTFDKIYVFEQCC